MTLVKPSEPWAVTADQAAQRRGYAAQSELDLRNALEEFCRARWPDARIVHEIVMGEGRVRADVAAIDTGHLAAFEVKGAYDDTTRLLHQVGMFQLCFPEVWMVVAENHDADAKLIRHLLPSVGLLVGTGMDRYSYSRDPKSVTLRVEAEAAPRPVVPEMLLRVMWAGELYCACVALGKHCGPKATRSAMVKLLLDIPVAELVPAVCAQLRSRDALWRADPPIRDEVST